MFTAARSYIWERVLLRCRSSRASQTLKPIRRGTITMIVPIAAGCSSDVVGRLVAERMGTVLGQPLIIENVPGADGRIGVGRVARARPDGYTIEFGFLSANVLNGAFLFPSLRPPRRSHAHFTRGGLSNGSLCHGVPPGDGPEGIDRLA